MQDLIFGLRGPFSLLALHGDERIDRDVKVKASQPYKYGPANDSTMF